MIKPNWNNSILNISATLAEFLGVNNSIPKIKVLEKKLALGYKNVVFVCLDGLGMFPLKQNLSKNSFLRKNVKTTVTSVFPSTTTNATSTLLSCSYPTSHGLFGWSLYMKELNRCVDIYVGADSQTKEKVDTNLIDAKFTFNYYFDKINSSYKTTALMPFYVKHENNLHYTKKEEMFSLLDKKLNEEGNQFVYCYGGDPDGEPDATMHANGVTSKEAKEIMTYYNSSFEKLANNHKDTLIIISADHGQTDIKSYIELYKDKPLLDTLLTSPYLDARATSFRVKKDKIKEFKKEIRKYKELKLYKTKTLLKKNYFGPITETAELLGDYITIVKNNFTQVLTSPTSMRFKGHHSSLTKREMILPLIIIN